jgi:hypothetical protein
VTYVHMKLPEIAPEFFLLHWADVFEILAAENHDTSLGNEECEFVLLLIGQL